MANKYFNTTDGPLVYNNKGNIAAGFSWFESTATAQVKAALARGDIFKLDSGDDFVYDSIEEALEEEKEETAG